MIACIDPFREVGACSPSSDPAASTRRARAEQPKNYPLYQRIRGPYSSKQPVGVPQPRTLEMCV